MEPIKNNITASKISTTTFIFLAMAPIVLIWYALYIYNFKHADNVFLYIIQIIADTISMSILLGLWITILFDIIIEAHHRIDIKTEEKEEALNSTTKPLSVDIFITTYGEDINTIAKTVEAAINIRFSHRTIILDDGKSEDVEDLAFDLGAEYITREINKDAKAGNINNALSHTNADFFAILDADHIPKEDFLEKLLPFFDNKEIAMVQSPQSFSNNNFIADGTSQAQDVFYKYVCPAKNVSNSAFSVGTNVIYRREAVDSIGGIHTSKSEDIWTTFLLHQKKWKTLFVNEVVAVGLAPESIIDFFKQQRRWATGAFEILLKQNPLYSDKLELDQKIQYFISNSFFLVGITILVYILMPIIYLLTGAKPLLISNGVEWLLHYIPYFTLYFTLTWLLLGQKIKLATMATALASFYPYLLGLFSVIFDVEQQWEATNAKNKKNNKKGSNKNKVEPIMKWIWPHVFLLIISIFSLLIGWYRVIEFWAVFFNTIWVALNIFLLSTFLSKSKFKNN